ncbi:MAG: hypothetical protein JSS65_00640 [Armatimonadetes bacterium]|nr:hypothetical protein [Armatimonadota bacterium]
MPDNAPARPAAVLGLTFLLVGLTFGFPFLLLPVAQLTRLSPDYSPQVGNIFACVAWAGWAHFVYAFRGQGQALRRIRDGLTAKRAWTFAVALATVVAVLFALRLWLGIGLFSGLVWVYFIDHFIKAEVTFAVPPVPKRTHWEKWRTSYQPILTFGWLSVVLLNVGGVDSYPWVLWTVSLALAVIVLLLGGMRKLMDGNDRMPLLSLFFVAEAMVWGTVSQAGGPTFLAGVYVFHVAAGSYYHYLGGYFFGASLAQGKDKWLSAGTVVAVNIAVATLGYAVATVDGLAWARPILGVEWFTVWVAVHLAASDLFPAVKSWRVAKA